MEIDMAEKKNPVGRPPKYKTAEELQKKIDEYFEIGVKHVEVGHDHKGNPIMRAVPTITALILYCGFCDRHSFYDMEKIEKFSHTIKNARTRIECHYEELVQYGATAGAIFALKNFGWRDKQEIEQKIEVNPVVDFFKKAGSKDESE